MRLEFVLTAADYVAFAEHVAATSPTIRRQQRWLRVVGAAFPLVVASLIIGLAMSEWVEGLVIGALGAAIMWFAYPALLRAVTGRTVGRLVTDGGAGPVGPATLALTDTGVTETVAGVTTTVTWDAITEVSQTATHYFVLTSASSGAVIPRTALGAGTFITELRAVLPSQRAAGRGGAP